MEARKPVADGHVLYARKSRLAASGEELGEQLLQSVREMKAELRGGVHTPDPDRTGAIHQEVEKISGLIPPEVDAGAEYREHVRGKHR